MTVYSRTDPAVIAGYAQRDDGMGYSHMSEEGRVHVTNALPTDEVFWREDLGHVNVSLIRQRLPNSKSRPIEINIREDTIASIEKIEINSTVIDEMTITRRNEPLISIVTGYGVFIIDGHHRIQRLIKDGKDTYWSHFLPPKALEIAHVQQVLERPDGAFVEVPESSYRLVEEAMKGGDEMWERIFRR